MVRRSHRTPRKARAGCRCAPPPPACCLWRPAPHAGYPVAGKFRRISFTSAPGSKIRQLAAFREVQCNPHIALFIRAVAAGAHDLAIPYIHTPACATELQAQPSSTNIWQTCIRQCITAPDGNFLPLQRSLGLDTDMTGHHDKGRRAVRTGIIAMTCTACSSPAREQRA